MRAVLLSAGQGSRLLPLTADIPKCLVRIGERTILDHQIDALVAAGIGDIMVVGGYRADVLAAHVEKRRAEVPGLVLRFNPFWRVASSIGSVWEARDWLAAPFVLANGDTIFAPDLIAAALGALRPGVNLLIEARPSSHHDDMLVALDGNRVRAVGKGLLPESAPHRSLGVIASPDADGGGYAAALAALIGEDEGVHNFHHAIVDRIARRQGVHAVLATSDRWQEFDSPADIDVWLERARAPVRR